MYFTLGKCTLEMNRERYSSPKFVSSCKSPLKSIKWKNSSTFRRTNPGRRIAKRNSDPPQHFPTQLHHQTQIPLLINHSHNQHSPPQQLLLHLMSPRAVPSTSPTPKLKKMASGNNCSVQLLKPLANSLPSPPTSNFIPRTVRICKMCQETRNPNLLNHLMINTSRPRIEKRGKQYRLSSRGMKPSLTCCAKKKVFLSLLVSARHLGRGLIDTAGVFARTLFDVRRSLTGGLARASLLMF
ncbi:uncharacterized protein LY89DRAFT_440123 [Mollisia scopiformis]|uniref:Uncharacterized protein n=1 Tax=Mollisia scopiformis TaxID=149040 RepID=A0A194XJK4_MOLSC|nr:uncharacterized protein LY89DRAFT_440123 [Mollisia scopiformis]KUJ20311.1 hypothetical protein LY89DRAFT_440123 [Mollisia scopiformis]